MFPKWETRLYHCSLPHYPLQGTFLRFVVLVIGVHYAPNVRCVTTSAHCVGVHHVVINVHHVASALIVATKFHHVDSVHHFLLFFIMLVLIMLLMFVILLLELIMLLFIMLLMLIMLVLILLLLMFIMLCCCSSCCYKCSCCLSSLMLLELIVIIDFLTYNHYCSLCYGWCSSCCFPPFYGWYYPYPYIVLQIKVVLEVDGCWLLVALAKLLQFRYVQVLKKLCDFFSIFFLYWR